MRVLYSLFLLIVLTAMAGCNPPSFSSSISCSTGYSADPVAVYSYNQATWAVYHPANARDSRGFTPLGARELVDVTGCVVSPSAKPIIQPGKKR